MTAGRDLDRDVMYHVDPDYNVAHILLMVVWLLATPDTFRSVALRFSKTPGVLHFHYCKVINTLANMAGTYVYWPHAEERTIISRSVQRRTGFPGVVGAVDGCHIQIETPREQPARYFNRHKDHSIVLQGVADEALLFRDVYVGEAGSTHDSRVFRRSPLCTELLENVQNYLADDQHILGDGAYILTDRVITPFRNDGNLTVQQLNFNHRLSSARVVIERAFGLLKGKWRRLKYLTSVNIEYAVKTIVACVVLHNFVLLEGDGLPIDVLENDIMNAAPRDNVELHPDEGIPVDVDHPNMPMQRDHPLLAAARMLGVEKRWDLVGRVPQPDE